MRNRQLTLVSVVVIVGMGILAAKDAPAQQPATQPAVPAQPRDRDPAETEFVISPMRVQEFPSMTYLFASFETTYAEMVEPIRTTMQTLGEAIRDGQLAPSAAPVFIYHGATMDPAKKFTLEIGFPVDENAKEFGDFKVKKTEPFRCATVIYSGPIRSVVNAYQQVFADLMAAGLEPIGESREMYLHWEGEDSVNNVTMIQIGVK